MSHTYSVLPVSKRTYDEIKEALAEAQYTHAFHDDGIIDLHGIAIQAIPEEPHQLRVTRNESSSE